MFVPGPLSRAVTLAGALFAMPFAAAPTQAGPAEVALLQSYIGEWRGRGTMTGDRSETVVCNLRLNQGNQDKVNYSGRCALAGTTLSVNGTLAYIDNLGRFEAAMTSNASFSGIAVGQRRGDGVVFNLRERDQAEGEPVTITSQIALSGGAINVQFNVVFEESGDRLAASVPFSR
jgi:hypothetical protein